MNYESNEKHRSCVVLTNYICLTLRKQIWSKIINRPLALLDIKLDVSSNEMRDLNLLRTLKTR